MLMSNTPGIQLGISGVAGIRQGQSGRSDLLYLEQRWKIQASGLSIIHLHMYSYTCSDLRSKLQEMHFLLTLLGPPLVLPNLRDAFII